MVKFSCLGGLSGYCECSVNRYPQTNLFPGRSGDGGRILGNGGKGLRQEIFRRLKNAVVQEKDIDEHGQNLWLSGENRSGGSVGRTQGSKFPAQ
jgi:hypothetical protein